MPSLTFTLESMLDQEVQELLNKEAAHQVKQPTMTEDFTISLSVVPKTGRKESLCSESKTIGSIHSIRTLQNGRCSHVKRPFKTGDGLVKIDLKGSYLAIPIWINRQKYLRFLWKDSMQELASLIFGWLLL